LSRALKSLPEVLLLGLALVQAGCDSAGYQWVPPEDYKVKVVSDASFVRTSQGDYVDGYLAEYDVEFQHKRMFMILELTPYLKGDRLLITGKFTGDTVRMNSGAQGQEKVPVFEVERAKPNVPKAPDMPPLK
jgi:hypothetical protein